MHIPATFINSTISAADGEYRMEELREGRRKLVYSLLHGSPTRSSASALRVLRSSQLQRELVKGYEMGFDIIPTYEFEDIRIERAGAICRGAQTAGGEGGDLSRIVSSEPRDCIVFGDAVNGIEAAIDAGMRAVAFTGRNLHRTLEDAGPDKIVGSFDELVPEIRFPTR